MNTCLSGALRLEPVLADLLSHGGRTLPVGAGFDVAVVPAPLAQEAIGLIGPLAVDPVGAVAAVEEGWAFFVPAESFEPGWPDHTRYLSYGSTITLPPPPGRPPADGARWVRWRPDGRVFTAPLLLQLALNAVGEQILTA